MADVEQERRNALSAKIQAERDRLSDFIVAERDRIRKECGRDSVEYSRRVDYEQINVWGKLLADSSAQQAAWLKEQ